MSEEKMHEVCEYCECFCKNKWTSWDWQLPPEEYCGKFKPNRFWKFMMALANLRNELPTRLDTLAKLQIEDWLKRFNRLFEEFH